MRHRLVAPTTPLLPISRFAVPFDENTFVDWLIDAEPGDRAVYYRGHLGFDRMPSANVLDRPTRANLHAVATRVMVAAGQGLVIPVQKRLGTEDYLYLAVKSRPGRMDQCRSAAAPRPSPTPLVASEPQTFPTPLAA
ncbi:MAG: hypothetical protein OJF62_002398 [Pseudolabrys sp.]|jgi:hypothetical protein|nr:hypothetical protein [Pseudolabrys sp.]